MKKFVFMLIVLFITYSGYIAKAAEFTVLDVPATSVSQSDLDKYSKMNLDELNAVAKPMPENNVKHYDSPLGYINSLLYKSAIPTDGEIYYINNKDNMGNTYQDFYRFLYVSPSSLINTVTYHIYVWHSKNGLIDRYGESSGDTDDKELYAQLKNQNSDDNGRSASSSMDNNNNTGTGNSSDNAHKAYKGQRLSGQNRIETAVKIAEELNSSTVNNVVISTGNDFPEALVGSVLAKKYNAPMLLVNKWVNDSKPTLDYIKNHLSQSGTVYVLGDESSVNSEIVQAIKLLGFTNIKRIDGSNKYDTNKAINGEINTPKGTPIVIATGKVFADALSISSVAALKGYPIVLTDNNNLPFESEETIKSIQPSKVFIIGGASAVSDSVKDKVKSITSLSDSNIIRLQGNDRYETSLNIAKYFNLDSDATTFATGENFPDALAGSVLAAKLNAPIILVGNDVAKQKEYIDTKKATNILIFGGTSVVKDSIENALVK